MHGLSEKNPENIESNQPECLGDTLLVLTYNYFITIFLFFKQLVS